MVKADDNLADSLIVGSGFMEFISRGEIPINLYLDGSQSQSIRARPTKVSSVCLSVPLRFLHVMRACDRL